MISSNMKYEIGSRVFISTEEADYEGNVYHYDEHIQRLVLNKVVSYPDNKVFYHLMTFFGNEILKAKVIDQKASKLSKLRTTLENETTSNNNRQEAKNTFQVVNEDDNPVKVSCPEVAGSSISTHVIKDLNHDFFHAIDYLKKQPSLSVSVDGINVGRFGEICLLQIGTNKNEIFQFNMTSVGGLGFESGLTELLTCSDIKKVVHDCRWLSDALHYQLKTNLTNVYDTQVADVMIYKQLYNKLPDHVRNLEECLQDYLNVKIETIPSLRNEHLFWKKCLEDEDLLKLFAQKVVYLHKLQTVTTERILEEFRNGVDIYLNSVKALSDMDVKKVCVDKLPVDFTNSNLKSTRTYQEPSFDSLADGLHRSMESCHLNSKKKNWQKNEDNKDRRKSTELVETQQVHRHTDKTPSDFSADYEDGLCWDRFRTTASDSSSSSTKSSQKAKLKYLPAGCKQIPRN